MLNLDTHVLLHALAGSLRAPEEDLLRRDSWGISAIVLWEVTKLAQLGRIELDLDDPGLGRLLSRVHVWPLDLAVCRAIPALDVAGDPADQIIAATSLVHRAQLVTRDRNLRRSKIVPLAG
ncbi:MAG: PIN domain-containing protein [Thermoleophilia bacterium]|nr:PIN domain-containing protein [Thermoleophilia bacterium]